jgi:cell division transport system ATP-binding protein
LIELYHLYKYYEDVPALEDINLKIEKGDMVIITGPSGAGKTTLLKLIFMEEKPTRGQILFMGQNISNIKKNEVHLYRRQMGFVFQDFRLIEELSVYENLSLAMEVLWYSKKYTDMKIRSVLQEVGLLHKIYVPVKKLSGGEQQRVAIARSIINSPPLLLADEPTGNLDPYLAEEIMKLFKTLNYRGTTVIIATHDVGLLKYARYIVKLERGRIVS